MNDSKLLKYLVVVLVFPITLAFFAGDRFRYPCQDPANWDKDFCKMPLCDVTRTCPEHIFKGQRDPRLGPAKDDVNKSDVAPMTPVPATKGDNCGK